MKVTVNRIWILTENDPDTKAILGIVSVHDTEGDGLACMNAEMDRALMRRHMFSLTPYDMLVRPDPAKRWEYADTSTLAPPDDNGPWEFVQAVVDTWERYKTQDGYERDGAVGTTYIWRRDARSAKEAS